MACLRTRRRTVKRSHDGRNTVDLLHDRLLPPLYHTDVSERSFSPGEALLKARVRAATGVEGRNDETGASHNLRYASWLVIAGVDLYRVKELLQEHRVDDAVQPPGSAQHQGRRRTRIWPGEGDGDDDVASGGQRESESDGRAGVGHLRIDAGHDGR